MKDRSSIPRRGRDFFRHQVQIGSGAHLASCPTGTGASLLKGKAAGGVKLTTDLHLVPRLGMCGSPSYAFMVQYLVNHKDNFTSHEYAKVSKAASRKFGRSVHTSIQRPEYFK
jgi:hypothetical protein